VVRVIKRNETFRVFGGLENPCRVFDPDRIVNGGMKYQQRFVHCADFVFKGVAFDVVQELFLNPERPPGQQDLGFPFGFDFVTVFDKEFRHVRGISRCSDRTNRQGLWHLIGTGQNGGPAKGMTDQKFRGFQVFTHIRRRRDQIPDV